ncbi:uncharacterized protein LOC115925050 [Strongylocentrotus purpuratus]|uniref:Uncharacterized protein n=1 Tax=Strongylocentrotus purpuratus TaxID=7668 RepID=A0A7M7P1D8_STRPU|nr:uncharacterized protein LOC115925050 [Strongylocentrotus purpuratus]
MADQTADTNVTSDQTENGQGPLMKEDPDTGEDTQNNEEVVTQQPKKNDGDDDDMESSFELEKGPSAEIKIDPDKLFSEEGCVSATAGVGSVSKEYMDGKVMAEYVGPNVSCVMNCAQLPTIVTDCTFELCSANYMIGVILCTVGLAFNTKLTWTVTSVEAEIFGTGVDTSEGLALSALGMKIGYADKEKREKKWAKKKQRWEKKVGPGPDKEESGEVNAGAD